MLQFIQASKEELAQIQEALKTCNYSCSCFAYTNVHKHTAKIH